MQAKGNGELQPTDRSKLCTRGENLALGNKDPPQQQADTTTFRPREVVGPPIEVVASNVDAPGSNFKLYWEQTSSLILEGIMLKSPSIIFALARTPGNKSPRTSGVLLSSACWLFTGDLCGCVAVLAVLCVVYGSPDVIF